MCASSIASSQFPKSPEQLTGRKIFINTDRHFQHPTLGVELARVYAKLVASEQGGGRGSAGPNSLMLADHGQVNSLTTHNPCLRLQPFLAARLGVVDYARNDIRQTASVAPNAAKGQAITNSVGKTDARNREQ